MSRWVLHIDMDAFFASCEQLTRPTLRGRPVLVGGRGGRGVVAGASYEARKYGARSAMPMLRARALVGSQAVVVQPRKEVYRLASRRVFDILRREVGLVEQLSIDEGYIEPAELVGWDAHEVEKWANNLRAQIREETGLPSSIGAGSGKQSAKIASGLAKPDGTRVIPAQLHDEILGPLPVGKLWGVGPMTQAKLRSLGVSTIADLAALSRREIISTLGSTIGPGLWDLARGIDDRPVAPRAVAKQVSTEHTYPEDLTTHNQVDAAVLRAGKGAHRRLKDDGRGARTISVKLRMSDFRIESRSVTLPYATDDVDTLLAMAKTLIRYPDEVGPIRLVGVSFSGLEEARQDVLFPELDRHMPRRVFQDTDWEIGVRSTPEEKAAAEARLEIQETQHDTWFPTQDVTHPVFGHGWIQGVGHGVISVRFETRTTGPGKTRTFTEDDPELRPGDPIESLDWHNWMKTQEN
ncbi:DNA polymerase IV [Corynebacterium poyangense]|uniref:DNA polymerase IV n=1 Tax=Corynebacterium poyangense TaxID=2684405 RepID=A0A7H0SPS3_9CORY|nr:DNA polymerase IV [Corynebacterium poyangense]QNQ90548.1 DNA polymerase IV [Corynebacterium poyangense]